MLVKLEYTTCDLRFCDLFLLWTYQFLTGTHKIFANLKKWKTLHQSKIPRSKTAKFYLHLLSEIISNLQR